MRLSEINQDDIISNFSSLKNFNSQINNSIKCISSYEDQLMLRDIKFYFNNIFDDDSICIVTDVKHYPHIAKRYLQNLKRLYKQFKLFIYDFLYSRISSNVLFAENVRMLA